MMMMIKMVTMRALLAVMMECMIHALWRIRVNNLPGYETSMDPVCGVTQPWR